MSARSSIGALVAAVLLATFAQMAPAQDLRTSAFADAAPLVADAYHPYIAGKVMLYAQGLITTGFEAEFMRLTPKSTLRIYVRESPGAQTHFDCTFQNASQLKASIILPDVLRPEGLTPWFFYNDPQNRTWTASSDATHHVRFALPPNLASSLSDHWIALNIAIPEDSVNLSFEGCKISFRR